MEIKKPNHKAAATEEFEFARQAVLSAPEIRTKKVDDLINRMNTGKYSVGADDVAGSILSRLTH